MTATLLKRKTKKQKNRDCPASAGFSFGCWLLVIVQWGSNTVRYYQQTQGFTAMGSKRITDKDLRELCERLNTITDSPLTAYSKDDDGKFHPNIGHYYIEGAYGGVGLRQITTRSTCETPLGGGYYTKRELFDRIHAYMRGMAVGYSMVEK